MNFLTKSTLYLSLLLITSSTFSQKLYRMYDEETKKWGIRDMEWKIIVSPNYDEIEPRLDTVFAGKIDGKTVLFNGDGSIRVPPIYQHILAHFNNFHNQYGYAAVTKNDKIRNSWGMIRKDGKVILPEKFVYVRAINHNLLVGRVDMDTLLQFHDANGKLLYKIPGRYVESCDFGNECFSVQGIDHKGRHYKSDGTLVYPEDPISGLWTDDNLIILRSNGKLGMINSKGKSILPFEFASIEFTKNNHIIASREINRKYSGLFDKSGNEIIPIKDHYLAEFGKLISVRDSLGEKGGFYDLKGNLIVPILYHFSSVHVFNHDYGLLGHSYPERYISATLMSDNTQFLVRNDGTIFKPENSKQVAYYSEDHPLLVNMVLHKDSIQPRYKAIDFKGNILLKEEYLQMNFTDNPSVLIVKKGNLFGAYSSGFIHLDAPEKTEWYPSTFPEKKENGYYIIKKTNNNYLFYSPKVEKIGEGEFTWVGEPNKSDYDRFRSLKTTEGRLIFKGNRTGMKHGDWIAVNDSGKEYYINKEEVPVSEIKNKVEEKIPMEEIIYEIAPAYQEEAISEVDVKPEFLGGETAMLKYLASNLKYPVIAVENAIEGRIMVNFIVEKDGSLTNLTIEKDLCDGCGKEVLRVISMMPKWKPGRHQGKVVRTKHSIPVNFKLD